MNKKNPHHSHLKEQLDATHSEDRQRQLDRLKKKAFRLTKGALSMIVASIALICTLITSILQIRAYHLQRDAYLLSIEESQFNRLAAKKAVRPVITAQLDFSTNVDSNAGGVYIQNVGLGPALILNGRLFYAGKVYDGTSGQTFEDFSTYPGPWIFSNLRAGSVIAPGERVLLLGMKKDEISEPRIRELVTRILPEMKLRVEFGSLHGEHWSNLINLYDGKQHTTTIVQLPDIKPGDDEYDALRHFYPGSTQSIPDLMGDWTDERKD